MPHLFDALQKHLQQDPENETSSSWVIKDSQLSGRGLFAHKPIKRGTLIFVNRPLIVGARGDSVGKKFCTICYKISDELYSCKKCLLIICSEWCNKSTNHLKECSFITQNWQATKNCLENSSLLVGNLTFLRALLLNEEEKLLLTMLKKHEQDTTDNIIQALSSKYIIPPKDIQLMKLTCSILNTNAFRISQRSNENKIPLRGLYPLSSLLNHSCVPNTRNVMTEDYAMKVYATKDIETGEEILTCYTGLLWCTPARRCHLYKTKHFWCACHRCENPSEMGTKLSALKCTNKECLGVLLPLNPLDLKTEWHCDICKVIVLPAQVSIMQSVLGSLVGNLNLDDQIRLETFMLERLVTFIPPSSHIFVDLQLRLAIRTGFAGASQRFLCSFTVKVTINNTRCFFN